MQNQEKVQVQLEKSQVLEKESCSVLICKHNTNENRSHTLCHSSLLFKQQNRQLYRPSAVLLSAYHIA
jgi:hypothetical protein